MNKETEDRIKAYNLKVRRKAVMTINKHVIDAGGILVNRNSKKLVKAFKMFGRMYSTNPRRVKEYDFDDPYWVPIESSLWRQLWFKFAYFYEGAKCLEPKGHDYVKPSGWDYLKRHY